MTGDQPDGKMTYGGLNERMERGKRRNEGLEEKVKDIRTKYLKFKFYEELMVINFAIQKQDEKRSSFYYY